MFYSTNVLYRNLSGWRAITFELGLARGSECNEIPPRIAELFGCFVESVAADVVTVQLVPLPSSDSGYRTSGSYPQLDGAADLAWINDALAGIVLNDISRLLRSDRTGIYSISGAVGSANSRYASFLLPVSVAVQDGQFADYWLSLSALVPSAVEFRVVNILEDETDALHRFGTLVREGLAENACLDQSDIARITDVGLLYFDSFAFDESGLVVGFDKGAVGPNACGRLSIVIEWADLETTLGPLGVELMRYVRN